MIGIQFLQAGVRNMDLNSYNQDSYNQKLISITKERKSIVCVGLDPVLERIPLKGEPEEVIVTFFTTILQRMIDEKCKPVMVKPNIAFYEQYDFAGLRALKRIIQFCHEHAIEVLIDAKRGDIGKTSQAYAKALFDVWKADATTIHLYHGRDTLTPFLDYCKKGKGVYVLLRTSNQSAAEIQEVVLADGRKMYEAIRELLLEQYIDGLAVVVGAPAIAELEKISSFFVQKKVEIPFLIPGIGEQGGAVKNVADALRRSKTNLYLHRIVGASSIIYAYEKNKENDYAGAAVRVLKKMNQEIGL